MAARVVERRERACENEEARPARAPQRARKQEGERREQRQSTGKERQREGNHPGVVDGIDRQRKRDPVRSGQKIAEAERPADREGGFERTLAHAVEQPDAGRQSREEKRRGIDGRHRQRGGYARASAGRQTPPSGEARDILRKARVSGGEMRDPLLQRHAPDASAFWLSAPPPSSPCARARASRGADRRRRFRRGSPRDARSLRPAWARGPRAS